MMEVPLRVAVIGAGAAGMIAAAEAADRGAQVSLLEKNSKTGVKILMSGGTRCNLTHHADAREISRAFGSAGRFLQPSLGAFSPPEVVEMFHQLGVPTKIESTGKVFPISDRALHVRDALQQKAIQAGVKIHLGTSVNGLARESDGGWKISATDQTIIVDHVIVTAGGKSWPGCGTTGDAYRWLEELGHTIVPPRPALVPLTGGYSWTHELSGVTIEDCIASVVPNAKGKQKTLAKRRSSLLFTHVGFSGPAAMDVSGVLTEAGSFADRQVQLDLLPDLNESDLRLALTDRSHDGGRQRVASMLSQWLPNRVASAIASHAGTECTIAELSRSKCHSLVACLKRLPMNVTGTAGFKKAEVTAGGVLLSEVDPRTMKSRLVPGLFIAGEVLDVDGPIGGYNFQAAFSTGRAAGIAAATR